VDVLGLGEMGFGVLGNNNVASNGLPDTKA
jgi:hypothetical protein